MKHHMRKIISILANLSVLLLLTSQAYANELPEFNADEFWFDTAGTQVDVVTPFEFESMQLRVRKRGETEVWTESFGPGLSVSVDLAHVVQSGLTDDRYTYEIRFVLGYRASDPADQEAAGAGEPMTYSTSGSFTVQDGSITDLSIPGYRSPGQSKGGTVQSDSSLEATSDPSQSDPSPTDFSDPGDLAMGGYAVFGSDNLSHAIAGKVRVRPTGSGSSAYANLTVESNAANSDQYFWHFGTQAGDLGIQRQRTTSGGKTTVLGIEEDAPESSLMISSSGRIGLGTATPANRLHIVSSESFPGLRIEHTGSGGSGGVVHDSSNRLRFRIDGSTRMTLDGDNVGIGTLFPAERLHVGGNARITGSVGIGTISPAKALHIQRASAGALGNNDTMIRIENTSATPESRRMLELVNHGSPLLVYRDTELGTTWSMSPVGNKFTIALTGTGAQEFQLDGGGNLTIQGSLTENSMRSSKTEFQHVDERRILDKLQQLPIEEWSYKHSVGSRHLGPMAEDFHKAFGLGPDNGIAPRDLAGVALTAAKALKAENDMLRDRIKAIEDRLMH